MTRRVHPVLAVLAVLLTVLTVKVLQPGPLFGSKPDAFPKGVVARTPAAPNIYGNDSKTRVLQLVGSIDTMWAGVFREAGDEYEKPVVETVTPDGGPCGLTTGDIVGLYCSRDQHIVVDFSDHAVVRAARGDTAGDDFLGYVLAHEVGHHVQYLRNVGLGRGPDVTLRRELQAECFAGVWGKAAGRKAPPIESYATDAAHGTAEQQQRWFERGYRRGQPSDCDEIWSSTPVAEL